MRYGKRFTGGCSSSGVQVLVNCPTFTVIAKGGNLGQENPPIVAETEDFPEEFAVDADMKNSASDVVDESSTLALFGSDVALDESGRL